MGSRRQRPMLAAAAVLAALGGCKGKEADQKKADRPAASEGGGAAGGEAGAPGATGQPVAIPWIENDWQAALAAARKAKKPIFVDLSAPWCHTCLAVQQGVLTDPSLKPYVDRFVWLEVDTDRPENAPVVDALPIDVWPTFYVVSTADSGVKVQARHIEAPSIAQLRELLEQGEQAHLASMARSGELDRTSPLGMVQAGDEAVAKEDYAAADEWYGKALAAAPPDWSRGPTTLSKQLRARLKNGDLKGCADLGMSQFQRAAQGATPQLSLFAQMASQCAEVLDRPRARLLLGRLGEVLRKVVDAPDSALSVDDQSDALRVLREMALELEDRASAKSYAVRQRDLLDRAVAQAKTARERMTHNWPRAEVYVYLGEGEKVIADLERSIAELPKEYDPPARLAWVHLQLGRHDAALPLAEKALGLAYGPRKASILRLIAEIHKGRGDLEAERKARQAMVDHLKSLPAGHKDEDRIEEAEKALAEVGKSPAPKKN
ncbi:MAG TPA: thioredoxin family protein [Kofleriaceae bacterium]|nr:thioredoxin family protein [Kofleriaceae bacterium]